MFWNTTLVTVQTWILDEVDYEENGLAAGAWVQTVNIDSSDRR